MAAISFMFFSVFLLLAARAWHKRKEEQTAKFDSPLEALDYFGELKAKSSGFYVATTYSENHLERISAFGLGSRGICQILVFSEGLLLIRKGERPLAIGSSALVSVSSNQVAIDKAVEPNGLMTITWKQNSSLLATHLRVVDKEKRNRVLDSINSLFTRAKQEQ